jgi:hypothetical protein
MITEKELSINEKEELEEYINSILLIHKRFKLLKAKEFISSLRIENKYYSLDAAKKAFLNLLRKCETIERHIRDSPDKIKAAKQASALWKAIKRASDEDYRLKELEKNKVYAKFQIENKTLQREKRNLAKKAQRVFEKTLQFYPGNIVCIIEEKICRRKPPKESHKQMNGCPLTGIYLHKGCKCVPIITPEKHLVAVNNLIND